jgi:MoaA/NifB/PqqE/SkfB family radical SAM enzyme
VHIVLSRRCAAGCRGCYVDATPQGAALSYQEACRVLDELSAMGVFHVALGGGEALELDYLFAVAEHARKVGITPNLTTSGLGLDEQAAARCAIFGRINVSVDGVGEAYRSARGFDGCRHAERALRLLRAPQARGGRELRREPQLVRARGRGGRAGPAARLERAGASALQTRRPRRPDSARS